MVSGVDVLEVIFTKKLQKKVGNQLHPSRLNPQTTRHLSLAIQSHEKQTAHLKGMQTLFRLF